MRRALARLAVAVLAAALPACGGDADPFVGKAAPTLDAPAGTWLNVDAPLAWKGLLGQVVYLEFGFLH